ncbi:Transmembrane protein [Trichinella nativa]|uniref:Transmembrane protein 230 n=2 Tax=Trichinella TaxID=6333 RepID=A0A0V1LJ49_9BILA|nr:Transmembrane protein [Trichinella sp. T9]KRY58825.1 Transmembrane protein [Trichinella britovi]KRZ59561.1 Transmembrane protein [Trichinella nativa]
MENLNINLKSEFRSRFNAENGGSQYSSEYRPLCDDFYDSQFEIPPHPIPWKAIILATLLFVFGTILIIIGALLLAGFCDPKYNDRTWPVLILGLLMFIPGLYHLRIAYYAFKGYKEQMSMQTEDFEELPHAIADFFEWFVHQILFYREVYPQESFEMVKFCNYPSYKSCCPSVIDYIREWHSILSATCEPGKMTVVIQIEDPAMRNKLVEGYYLKIFIRGSQGRKLLPNWKSFEDSLPDIISRLISVTEVENARHPLITETRRFRIFYRMQAENSEKDSGIFVPLVDGRIVPIGTVASDNMKMNILLLRPIN